MSPNRRLALFSAARFSIPRSVSFPRSASFLRRAVVGCLGLLVAAWMLAAPVAAQDDSPLGDRFELEARLFAAAFDNFFQAPPGSPEEDVTSYRLEARLYGRLTEDGPWKVFGQAALVTFDSGLDDSKEVGVGLLREGDRHRFEVFLQTQEDRPSFDVGDEFDRVDVDRLSLEYSIRASRDWELTAFGELEDQTFAVTSQRNNEFPMVGGAIRYRGWGYELSPEIGVEVGDRDAVDPNEDHDQTDWWLQLRSIPTPRLYLSLRYRDRSRSYDIGVPTASNFGREDDRQQWTLAANIKVVRHLSADVYYSYEDAESTKASRNFTTSLVGVGLKVEY